MATKYLDYAGLTHIINKLKTRDFNGQGLSKEDFTTELKTQLTALNTKLKDFDPSGVATDTNLSALQTKVDGLVAIINQEGTADGDKIINKLNEVFAFLAGVSSDDKLNAILSEKADKSTTLEGYGITDAKIEDGTVTLGAQSITPLTEHQSLAAYAKTSDMNAALAGKLDSSDVTAITNAEIDALIAAD